MSNWQQHHTQTPQLGVGRSKDPLGSNSTLQTILLEARLSWTQKKWSQNTGPRKLQTPTQFNNKAFKVEKQDFNISINIRNLECNLSNVMLKWSKTSLHSNAVRENQFSKPVLNFPHLPIVYDVTNSLTTCFLSTKTPFDSIQTSFDIIQTSFDFIHTPFDSADLYTTTNDKIINNKNNNKIL